jgi:hypothetical protein
MVRAIAESARHFRSAASRSDDPQSSGSARRPPQSGTGAAARRVQRLVLLDAFRLVAALSVLMFHYVSMGAGLWERLPGACPCYEPPPTTGGSE